MLVERTVKDVVPALKTNSKGLKTVLDDLLKQYKTKQDEMEKWKVRDRQSGHVWTAARESCASMLMMMSLCRRRIMFRSCSSE